MNKGVRHTEFADPASVGKPPVEFSDDVVRRARLIQHRGGYNAREVQEHLRDEGFDVPLCSLENWLRGTSRRYAGFPN